MTPAAAVIEILDFGKPYAGPHSENLNSHSQCSFALRYTVGFRSRRRLVCDKVERFAESSIGLSAYGDHKPEFKVLTHSLWSTRSCYFLGVLSKAS